jgi:hypothetical protein
MIRSNLQGDREREREIVFGERICASVCMSKREREIETERYSASQREKDREVRESKRKRKRERKSLLSRDR